MSKEEVEGENGKDGLASLKYSFGGICGREVIKAIERKRKWKMENRIKIKKCNKGMYAGQKEGKKGIVK